MASPATAVRCGCAAELRPVPDPGPIEPVAPLFCLHCGAAGIDPAVACPRCRHFWPRHHGAGISHLDLLAVEDPEQLRVALLRRWPRLDATQQHSFDRAARSLGWGPRRLLFFVVCDEVAALQNDLARHGVRCRLYDEPSWPWGLIALFSLSLVVFTSVRYGPGFYGCRQLLRAGRTAAARPGAVCLFASQPLPGNPHQGPTGRATGGGALRRRSRQRRHFAGARGLGDPGHRRAQGQVNLLQRPGFDLGLPAVPIAPAYRRRGLGPRPGRAARLWQPPAGYEGPDCWSLRRHGHL